ncbi:hypothetical protein IHE45_13G063100 [Dioscorea alata]|uniref:Uncharacterized protein n=1 Tax=Dioscorea alata TaxID=55571 RepID=A0ACB7UYR4_DIOAL|nr:hypothetical protein IHE45_13G063100 [Dioscorea alata]
MFKPTSFGKSKRKQRQKAGVGTCASFGCGYHSYLVLANVFLACPWKWKAWSFLEDNKVKKT